MANKMQQMARRVSELVAQAREYHRTGNVVLRAQIEENIRQVAPRAYAAKVIREAYKGA